MQYPTRLKLSILALLSLLSLLWLATPIIPDNFASQGLQSDPDSVLFIRLFEQSILKGELLNSDNYGCFPYSVELKFPPFHLNFLLHLAWLFHAIFPGSEVDPSMLVGVVPIFFVWGTSLMLIYTLWKLSSNFSLVLLCAFFLLPGRPASLVSGFLKLDYDFLISFFIWLWLCSCLLYLRKPRLISFLCGGAACTLLTFTWTGSPLFFFFVVCQATLSRLMDDEKSVLQLKFSASTLVAGSIPVFYYQATVSGSLSFSIASFSCFQPLCMLIGGVFLLTLSACNRFSRPRTTIILSGLILFLLFGIVFHDQLLQAGGLLLHKDPVHKNISELAPLLHPYPETPVSSFFILSATFGPLIFFIPIWLIIKKPPIARAEWQILRNWLIILLLLSLHQQRFVRWLSIGSGLYSGITASMLFTILNNKLSGFKFKNLELALLFLPPFLWSAYTGNFMIRESNSALSEEQADVFKWINSNTPATSGYADECKPEYGILTYRNESNLLAYYAKRPVVVSNAFWGFRTMAEIFSSDNEDEAAGLCEKYGVRYILLNTGENYPDDYYNFWRFYRSTPPGPEYKLLNQEIPRSTDFRNWFYFWLRDRLALNPLGNFRQACSFRVIYASNTPQTLSKYFVFEAVEGAKFRFQADPETIVTISLELTFNQLSFVYENSKKSDANGCVEFILPYSTGYNNGRVVSDKNYKTVFVTNRIQRKGTLSVSDDEVKNGLRPSNAQSLFLPAR